MWSAFQEWLGIESVPTPVRRAEARCDAADLEAIRSAFRNGRKRRTLKLEAFGQWLGVNRLQGTFQKQLYRAAGADDDGLNYQQFMLTLEHERKCCTDLMKGNLGLFISQCLEWNEVEWSEDEVQSIVEGLQAKGQQADAWLKAFPIFQKSLHSMLHGFRPDRQLIAAPRLQRHEVPCILTQSWAWLLASNLRSSWREEWELLFSNVKDGWSFQTCFSRIRNRGVTLVVIEDESGSIFGGMASTPWEPNGRFYGDPNAFLFSLRPSFDIYKSSGANDNFQWCGEKFKELPNGIGFGGQVNFFALFLDASFDSGMSFATNTYASPSLSSSPRFIPRHIEFWLMETIEDDDFPQAVPPPTSVLDRFKEEQKMMSIGGWRRYSDGYRDVPSDEL